jgi:hypothetical protein
MGIEQFARFAALRAGQRRKEGRFVQPTHPFRLACARLQGGLTHVAPMALRLPEQS